MGMFDSVYVPCPRCGAGVEFQSKAGKCELAQYSSTNVPAIIAADIDGDQWRCDCGALVTARAYIPPTVHVIGVEG